MFNKQKLSLLPDQLLFPTIFLFSSELLGLQFILDIQFLWILFEKLPDLCLVTLLFWLISNISVFPYNNVILQTKINNGVLMLQIKMNLNESKVINSGELLIPVLNLSSFWDWFSISIKCIYIFLLWLLV